MPITSKAELLNLIRRYAWEVADDQSEQFSESGSFAAMQKVEAALDALYATLPEVQDSSCKHGWQVPLHCEVCGGAEDRS